MHQSRKLWLRFLVMGLTCVLIPTVATLAQQLDPAFNQVVGFPRGLPHLPPQGAWGEVINVTSRWVVIQNHSGQQYPISVNDLGQFLVRWPSSVDALGNQSLIEAVGRHLGNNIVQTEHIDVFEGNDQSLVSPTYNTIFSNNAMASIIDPSFNQYYSPWHFGGGLNMLYGWAYPTGASLSPNIPSRIHVVGSPVNRSPLQLNVPGNHLATVIPVAGERYTVTQVTRGNLAYIRKGDHAFLMPMAITPRGLVLSQFVLYKTISFVQFIRAR
jgi:hypothetical protein